MGRAAPPKGPTQGSCFRHPQLLHLAATLVAFARMRVALMMIPGTFKNSAPAESVCEASTASVG